MVSFSLTQSHSTSNTFVLFVSAASCQAVFSIKCLVKKKICFNSSVVCLSLAYLQSFFNTITLPIFVATCQAYRSLSSLFNKNLLLDSCGVSPYYQTPTVCLIPLICPSLLPSASGLLSILFNFCGVSCSLAQFYSLFNICIIPNNDA